MNHPPPTKLNVKTGPLFSLYFGIYYSFRFVDFFALLGVFSGDCGFLYSRSIPDLLLFLQQSFPLSQTSSYVTAYDPSKVVLQIRSMCRASSGILGILQ